MKLKLITLSLFFFVTNYMPDFQKRMIDNDDLISNQDSVLIKNEWGILDQYEFEITENGTNYAEVKYDDWIIRIGHMTNSATSVEYAPASYFYEVHKWYDSKGNIRERTKMMCGIMIGGCEMFDENGLLINENAYYKDSYIITTTREYVLQLLEKEGWFNRQTGEVKIIGIENDIHGVPSYKEGHIIHLETDGTFYKEISKRMKCNFYYPNWYVGLIHDDYKIYKDKNGIMAGTEYFYKTQYVIKWDTGEFFKEIVKEQAIID